MQDVVLTQLSVDDIKTIFREELDAYFSGKPDTRSDVQQDQWLNLAELCQYLPDKPVRATVYGWVHHRQVPCHRRGKKLYFLKSEIDTWLKQGRRKTVTETASEVDTYLHNKKKG